MIKLKKYNGKNICEYDKAQRIQIYPVPKKIGQTTVSYYVGNKKGQKHAKKIQ